MPTLAELIKAMPEPAAAAGESSAMSPALQIESLRPVPLGRLRRLGLLASLQAKIAAAYCFYWLRGWFSHAEERERLLAQTHWRTAAQLLDSMGYLRGAAMKFGQTLANFPDIAPQEIVETLDQLHYDAPPMHWSLLKEMVNNELGDDPGNVFGQFEKRAFAAASLGQVHRARLRSGEPVAVKIQYPGIGRAIAEDFRNLNLFLLAGRLQSDWASLQSQMEDLSQRLERETDYREEAAMLTRVHALFRAEDGIRVPRAYPEVSTARVLTMDRIEGLHLDQFLRTQPSQAQRNEAARRILRALYRMLGSGRMMYADFHPGNFLFLENGDVGVIDFGFMVALDDELWELSRRMETALSSGRREDLAAAVKEWSWITGDPAEEERLRLSIEFTRWAWGWRHYDGIYDFGDETEFRRGVGLWTEMVRKRYCRARACTPAMARLQFGYRSLLYRLKARVDARDIVEHELQPMGLRRSAPF
jgi:predicted unusual protein kinase regulating ubiquinone biosynthesis (AarF/ABC1/UbiB family)